MDVCHTTLMLLLQSHTMSHQYLCKLYLIDTSNLGRCEASWEAVPSPSKTSNRGIYHLQYERDISNYN